MFDSPFSKKQFILTIIFALLILVIIFFTSFYGRKTTLVFCDVGQGDGVYLRIQNRTDILIDAGPGRKILDCLGRYMPFYDRSIELAIISHAQKDHFGGFINILDRYHVKKFWMGEAHNYNQAFIDLLKKIRSKDVTIEFPKDGDLSLLTDAKINFYWPSESFITQNSLINTVVTSPFRKSLSDLNDFSLIFSVQLKSANILFTGDASPHILNGLLQESNIKTDILKIPHHGSKNGLTSNFLELADPEYGVISSGKNNSYGHPHETVLNMLKAQNVKIKRTDATGDIVFKFN